jgi:gliding motility-associated-like protein
MINHWQTWQGCDSLYVWNVTVVDSVMSYRNANLCRGDFFHGMPMFSDAVVVENDKTYFGCDSTIIWTISVSDSVLLQQNLLLCEGDAFNGVAIYSDTTWMELLQTQQGCDSTVMTYIAILPVQTTTQTLDACYGDLFNGISLTVDTVITIQHTGFNGCDSNTVYQVRVKAPLNLRIEGGTSLCGDGITTLSAGNFSAYQWSNGETAPSISVTSPGEYAVTVTASTGCTASAGVQVTGRLSASSDFDDPLCFGDSNGRIEVIITEGTPPFKFSLNGKEQASPVFNDLAAGIYQLVVSDAGGCVDEDTLELIAPDLLLLQPGDNPKINLGDSVQLNPYTNANSATWRWDPPAGLSCADCPFPIASPLETTVYTLEVVNQNQCSISANLTVTVNKNRQIYVPTAFSPNDDGVNDFFTVYSGKGVTFIRRFEVYDRWGGLVFTAPANSPSGEETLHWDGTLKGKNLQPAVFTWLIVIELADGTQEKYEGSVTLMR